MKENNLLILDEARTDWSGYTQYLSFKLDQEFKEQISAINLVEPLKSALDYAIFPTGKLIRPIISALICTDLKGDFDNLVKVLISLELLHCASLIHDDLPALDNDDLRRGKATTHKKFGEATAILAGDTIIPITNKFVINSSFSDSTKISLINILSNAYIELCEGQQLDMLVAKNENEIEKIHQLKTGGLFKAAVLMGALCSNQAITESLEQLTKLGLKIGLLFQILDDLLDEDSEKKGRAPGSDAKNNKNTYTKFLTAEKLLIKKNEIHEEINQIFNELSYSSNLKTNFSGTRAFIKELV
jgi:geranylgeranyl pyrophosphate synthase